jgi:hypothetical protein
LKLKSLPLVAVYTPPAKVVFPTFTPLIFALFLSFIVYTPPFTGLFTVTVNVDASQGGGA